MMRVLVLAKDPERGAFDGLSEQIEPFFCGSVMAATAIVEEINPRVVFIDASVRGASDFLRWLKRETGSAAVVTQKGPISMDYLAWGADSTIETPLSADLISETLKSIGLLPQGGFDYASKQNEALGANDGFWDISDAFGDAAEIAPVSSGANDQNITVVGQEVISVWGAQGGAGRTTLALLLAEALSDFDVLLVDLCFKEGPGDVNALLELPITPHIGRLMDNRQDRRKGFADSLIKPKTSRFAVIQPPPTIDQAENVSPDDIIELIDQARRMFQIVILDLPDDLSPVTLEAVDMSTSVLMVTTNHSGSMARLESLKSFIRKDIMKLLVLNRFDGSKGRARDIAHFLDMPLAGTIGTVEGLELYANKGKILKLRNNVTDSAINDILKLIFGLDRYGNASKRTILGILKAGLASANRLEARQ